MIGDFSELPDTSKMSLNELHQMGIYPNLDFYKNTSHREVTYNEMKEDGKIYSAYSKMTWDKYDVEVQIKIPRIMSDTKVLEIFQSILDNVVRTIRGENDNRFGIF